MVDNCLFGLAKEYLWYIIRYLRRWLCPFRYALQIKPIVFLSHISDHLRKVSLHELNVKKIALHQMVTHEHHSQPLFGNIKRKFNGFHIWLLFSLTRLWHVHNSRSIFSIFYCEWGNSSCIVFGYQHFIAFIHGEEKLR